MKRTTVQKLTLAILAPLFAASAASAATLYSETSNGANPALTVTGLTPNGEAYVAQGNTVTPASTVILDNVVVPTYPDGGLGGLNITRVTVQDRQPAGAAATSAQLYYASVATDRANATPPTMTNATAVGSPVAIGANGTANPVNTPVVFGDGVNTLFTLTDAQLNFTDPGVTTGAEFYLGVQFSDTTLSPGQGLRLAFPDAGYENPNEYFEYNTSTNGKLIFSFFQPNDANAAAGIWVTVEGNAIPEPASLGLAALGGLALLGRRPSKKA